MQRVCDKCGKNLENAPMINSYGKNFCFHCSYWEDDKRYKKTKDESAIWENTVEKPWLENSRYKTRVQELEKVSTWSGAALVFIILFSPLLFIDYSFAIILVPGFVIALLVLIYAESNKKTLNSSKPVFRRSTETESKARAADVVFDYCNDPKASAHGYPADWSERKSMCYKRDKYVCQICGSTNREVHAHHVKPIYFGGNHNLQNLVTLCAYCHKNRSLYYNHRRLVNKR